MLAGLSLFYVGAVSCLNGFWLLGRIRDKKVAVIDVFVGGIRLKCVLASRQLGRGNTIPGACGFESAHRCSVSKCLPRLFFGMLSY